MLVLAYDVARKEIGAGASPRCLAALLGVAVFVLTDNVVICVFALGANIPFVFPHRDDGVPVPTGSLILLTLLGWLSASCY